MFKANYIPLFNKIKDQLNKMRYKTLSWIGRINAVKNVCSTNANLLLPNDPNSTPPDYFRKLQPMVLKYIWARKCPRIVYDILVKGKERGGLAAPDFKKYYQAISISRIADWMYNKREKSWVNLEISQSRVDIEKMIWIPPQFRDLGSSTNSLTRNTLKIWDGLSRRHHWDYNSPLMSLIDTKYFKPGKEEHIQYISLGGLKKR